jgi:adenosylcobinamide-GDP ribazoletransferase
VPVPSRFFEGHDGSVSRAVRAFPLAGLVLAMPSALLLWLLLEWEAEPLLAALIAIAIVTLLSGALHEDGLADASDGFGGGRDREHILSIMKDSRTGSYGVIALILSFSLRATALASLAGDTEPDHTGAALPALPALALLAAAALSRALMVAHWEALAPARLGGVASGAGKPEPVARTFALVSAVLICIVLLLSSVGLAPLLFALVLAAVAAYGVTRFADEKIGGHTGDTIGATQQAGEIVFLVALALAV